MSQRRPIVVVGDFNAVREHVPIRRPICQDALVDAAEASGAGWPPTYRADRWYQPLIQIDHVLVTPGVEAGRVETVRVGPRHAQLALVAWLQVG